MPGLEKLLLAWSGGKDSALALREVRERGEGTVVSLLTTLNATLDRVSMHGVRRALVEAQAAALGIPLHLVDVGPPAPAGAQGPPSGFTAFPSNEEYEAKLREALLEFRGQGVRRVVYGDIFLEDLKAYRERTLGELGMAGVYPLWKRDSRLLMEEFLAQGFRAITVCTDGKVLGREWVGRTVDRAFLDSLPAGVDPCGENGEFHTFVHDGPIFRRPVPFNRGPPARQGDYWFLDLT